MRTAKLFLHLLSQLVKPGKGQHHNLTIDDEGDLLLSMMCGERYVLFVLRESEIKDIQNDYITAAEQIAQATKEHLEAIGNA